MSRSGNTKQVIHWQDNYDTVFDNSIPFRKNDLLRITYFRIPGMPGLHFVCHCRTGTVTPVTVFHLSHGQCRGPAGSESESQPEAGGSRSRYRAPSRRRGPAATLDFDCVCLLLLLQDLCLKRFGDPNFRHLLRHVTAAVPREGCMPAPER